MSTKIIRGKKSSTTDRENFKTIITQVPEVTRFRNLLSHPSVYFAGDSKASANLVVRRALALLESHLKNMTAKQIEAERNQYMRLLATGFTQD
jgi:hypothetical protein